MAVTTTGLILAAQGLSATASVGGGIVQAGAQRAQGSLERTIANINAETLDAQAKDSIQLGEAEASALKRDARRLQSQQRAAMAANGVDVDEGTALEIQQDTALVASQDALQIRYNAARQAFGFKKDAGRERLQGKLAKAAGNNAARGSLISGGIAGARDLLRGAYEYEKDPYLFESQRPKS